MNPGEFLQTIAAETRRRTGQRRAAKSEEALRRELSDAPDRPAFADALERPGLRVIAELKKASPSRGLIRPDFDPAELAAELEDAGAAALSVLTEETFFLGSTANLRAAAGRVRLPLLCKDFIQCEYQLVEARLAGASAALLIAALLDDSTLRDLARAARELGLEVLGEAHSEEEIDRIAAAGIRLIGVNARDLATFACSLDRAEILIGKIPSGHLAVAESAITSPDDLRRLSAAGARAFLIGETLMRAPRPGARLRELAR